MNVHELIAEQVGLAKTYAEDGAFHSAARVLLQLSYDVEKHAQACDSDINERLAPNDCPGHVASDDDPKVCAACGVHIDELR